MRLGWLCARSRASILLLVRAFAATGDRSNRGPAQRQRSTREEEDEFGQSDGRRLTPGESAVTLLAKLWGWRFRSTPLAPYLPGALITTYDGIVGPWPENGPEQGPGEVPADVDTRMRRWEARVRAHVLDFELLSAFIVKSDVAGTPPIATLIIRDKDGERELAKLVRPSAADLRKYQLKHVYNYADLRRDRAAEILSQISGIETFFYGLCPLHPERHRFTIELVAAFYRALVSTEMRMKHELAVPRPVEFSPQIMPMIQTPGHSSFPAGHAAESFMLATVLSALMQAGNPRYADWDIQLARLAARISVNRVIAGVHFPIDMAAGLVLGLAVGRYFVALAKGEGEVTPYKFVGGETYGESEFPWESFRAERNTCTHRDAAGLCCSHRGTPFPLSRADRQGPQPSVLAVGPSRRGMEIAHRCHLMETAMAGEWNRVIWGIVPTRIRPETHWFHETRPRRSGMMALCGSHCS